LSLGLRLPRRFGERHRARAVNRAWIRRERQLEGMAQATDARSTDPRVQRKIALNSAREHEDQKDDHYQSNTPRGIVTPAATVRPSGEGSQQK
jgi:hypothetical protein